jgi:hypothetical protein
MKMNADSTAVRFVPSAPGWCRGEFRPDYLNDGEHGFHFEPVILWRIEEVSRGGEHRHSSADPVCISDDLEEMLLRDPGGRIFYNRRDRNFFFDTEAEALVWRIQQHREFEEGLRLDMDELAASVNGRMTPPGAA